MHTANERGFAVSPWLLEHATALRLGTFFGVLVLLIGAEVTRPFRGAPRRLTRWVRHLSIATLGNLALRLLFPMLAIGFGGLVDEHSVGLLQTFDLPRWLLIVLGVVALDLAIYTQHRVFHRQPLLWRLHRMHHSDTAFDASTGIRFHPIEIVVSMLIKIGVVVVLGIPALAVLLFEILLSATSLFSHADIRLPAKLESNLRQLLVTPDLHRIHHSVLRHETDSNFGFCLSLWDRLFGSYRAAPERDPQSMPIGLGEFREPEEQQFLRVLSQPFRTQK